MLGLYVISFFDNSSNLTLVYGITVTGTMIITFFLICIVAIKKWYWNKSMVFIILFFILVLDISFFVANLSKIYSRSYVPVLLATIMFIIMNTCKIERLHLNRIIYKFHGSSLKAMIVSVEKHPFVRLSGTAVYISRIPIALIQNLKHNKILHKKIILLTICTIELPYIPKMYRVTIEKLSSNFFRVIASYGWCEIPNVEEIFHRCNLEGLNICMIETSFFMSYESLTVKKNPYGIKF